jgi:hypothetical protein
MSALQNTIIAVKPISPGSSRRNGVAEAWKDSPKTIGISGGTIAALSTMLASVTYVADLQARNVWSSRGPSALRAAAGNSAVATAPGKYRRTSDRFTATT